MKPLLYKAVQVFPVFGSALSRIFLEQLVKMGKIPETAFHADVGGADPHIKPTFPIHQAFLFMFFPFSLNILQV